MVKPKNILKMNSTKVFVFEYISCYEDLPPEIAVEGLSMFSMLMRDFSEFANPFSLKTFNTPIDYAEISSYFIPNWKKEIYCVEKDLIELFKSGCEKSDYVCFIAPEDEKILYKLTKIADKYNNLCSPSKAVKIASDKWRTYKKLKKYVNFPKTSLKPLSINSIVKPRFSCGGEGIKFYKKGEVQKNVIYQEYIEGRKLSVSFIAGDEIKILSINEQIIDSFKYFGSKIVTLNSSLEKEIENIVHEISNRLKLFGYCGVDLIHSDEFFVVDVNARLTTSSIMLKDGGNINIGKSLIDNFYSKLNVERAKKGVKVFKGDGELTLVKYKDSKISLTKLEKT